MRRHLNLIVFFAILSLPVLDACTAVPKRGTSFDTSQLTGLLSGCGGGTGIPIIGSLAPEPDQALMTLLMPYWNANEQKEAAVRYKYHHTIYNAVLHNLKTDSHGQQYVLVTRNYQLRTCPFLAYSPRYTTWQADRVKPGNQQAADASFAAWYLNFLREKHKAEDSCDCAKDMKA